jgi:hypothetical protein
LQQSGVNDVLADPVLDLYASDGSLIATNDNWKDTQQIEIEASQLAPENDLESAIVATLQTGPYTAIVRGRDSTTGIGLAEIFDLDAAADSRLANISTRAFVQIADNVLIGGFILDGDAGSAAVVLRAIGPSLAQAGVAMPLADPTLELHDGNGALQFANDNWEDDPTQAALILASGLAPTNPLESAIAITLPAGNYTAIVAGKNATAGIGLVEIYNLSNN